MNRIGLRLIVSSIVIAGALAGPGGALARDERVETVADARLANARQLYASAAYTDALAMLDGLLLLEPSVEARQSIDLYRTLCLVALGRAADAEKAVEAILGRDPLYRPPDSEVPPRVKTAFSEARLRLLPGVIQQTYAQAKAAFDASDFATAAARFESVLAALGEPDIAAAASQPPLADLRTLAEGFRDLSAKAIAPEPEPEPVAPPVPAPVPGRIYHAEDRDVVPPVTLQQRLPSIKARVSGEGRGVIEVIIDATGAVESARMVVPVTVGQDHLILSAARAWKYEPARLGGAPVKFRKLVRVTLQPSQDND